MVIFTSRKAAAIYVRLIWQHTQALNINKFAFVITSCIFRFLVYLLLYKSIRKTQHASGVRISMAVFPTVWPSNNLFPNVSNKC